MVAASIFSMMKGLLVVFVVLFSKVFLRRKYFKQHGLIVGLSAVLQNASQDESNKSDPVGFLFIVVGLFITAAQFVVEEMILNKYVIHPLKLVGWEGVWGCLYWAILLPIFQFTSCNWKEMCPSGHVEDVAAGFKEMGEHPSLIIYTVITIISTAFFNFFGIAITKYASAAARVTIKMLAPLIVWVFYLAVPPRQTFSWLQFGGFTQIFFGTFIFNEIIVLPWLGFNQNTKKVLTLKLQALKAKEESLNLSPKVNTEVNSNEYKELLEDMETQKQINLIKASMVSVMSVGSSKHEQ